MKNTRQILTELEAAMRYIADPGHSLDQEGTALELHDVATKALETCAALSDATPLPSARTLAHRKAREVFVARQKCPPLSYSTLVLTFAELADILESVVSSTRNETGD